MKSVRQIKDILGLDTIHQARNRIKAVQEVIQPHMKRGENNEILVGQEGISVLSKLQDLYESGLLLSEAAEVIKSDNNSEKEKEIDKDSYTSTINRNKPDTAMIDYLIEEISFQRDLILAMAEGENEGVGQKPDQKEEDKWWTEWL
jgi:hypothetical protein